MPSKPPIVVVIDADASRRATICAGFPSFRVIETISLHDAYGAVEDLQPGMVVLSDTAAQDSGLAMFAQLVALVGARWVIYGQVPPPLLSQRMRWVPMAPGDGPEAVVAAVVTAGPGQPATVAARAGGSGRAGQVAQGGRGPGPEIIVIGASTGGVGAIETLLSDFPADCPPTLIVQHIRPGFIEGMIRRLAGQCAALVVPARDGVPIERGTIYVAAQAEHHLQLAGTARPRCRILPADDSCLHRPSVDALFLSAATYGPRVAAALLTGMGADGARGLAAIRAAGGFTIAQDRVTCTVYGMPKAAVEAGAAVAVLPLREIAQALLAGVAPQARGQA